MSEHIEEVEHLDGPGTLTFVKVWVTLLVLTAGEVFLAYEQVGVMLMLTILVAVSIVKAALIIAYFMHLKYERLSLFLTLFPMLVFCILLMTIFFLGDAVRLPFMRPAA
ncbi:MAG: cytochrome C oxidase subunit IV family protein [Bryobacteraceae bacterium]